MKPIAFLSVLISSVFFPVPAISADDQARPAARPVVLKAVTNNPKISGQYQGMVILKRLVEERTAGKIMVEVFSDGVLGDEEQLAEGMQSGIVDFTIHSSSKYANFVPEMDVYSPPYSFKNWAHMKAVVNSEVNDKLVKTVMERRGDYFVGVFTEGVRNVFTKSEISKLDDLKGFKIRTMTGPSEVSAWRALGANPTPTAYLDLHRALQTGLVDGAENTMTAILGMKFYESSKFVLRTGHNYMAMPGVLSGRFINKLPRELGSIVLQAARDAAKEQLDWAIEFDRRNEQILKEIYGVKVSELSREDYVKAIDICREIHVENARRIRMEKEQRLMANLAGIY